MKLEALKLYQFKNHSSAEYAFHKRLVAFSGLNGKGKTNALDAICFLCQAKSYFSSTDAQCIQKSKDEAGIIGRFAAEEKIEIAVKLRKAKKKEITKNGKAYSSLSDHLGQFFAVVIAPGDIYLIYGDNSDRRRFVDKILSQVDRSYLKALLKYNRLLAQRNQHLKSNLIDHHLLDSLDIQMQADADLIFAKRLAFVNEFAAEVNQFYNSLSTESEESALKYKSQLQDQNFIDLTAGTRHKDIQLRRSTAGIHKDELDIFLNGHVLKRFGSQGQIKSFLISLKLAEFKYYQKKTSIMPFLLLDDIFEKIDDNRAKALTGIIKSGNFGQLFVTDTQAARLRLFCEQIDPDFQLITL